MEKFKVIEAFSGIGSQAKAIQKAGLKHWGIINTIEWDVNAIIAYFLIHHGEKELEQYKYIDETTWDEVIDRYNLSMDGKTPMTESQRKHLPKELKWRLAAAIEKTNNLGSIEKLCGEDFKEDFDLLTYSFPCQDLSIAGVWHGLNSGISKNIQNRSGMLWEVERILIEKYNKGAKLPRFLLMENVTNILSKKHIGDFDMWKSTLEDLGYVNKHYELNATYFGVPQHRVRVFMVSVFVGNDIILKKRVKDYLEYHIFRGDDMVSAEKPIPTRPLKDYLRVDMDNKKYRVEADESQPNDTPSRAKIWESNIKIFTQNSEYTEKPIPTITTKQDRNPNSGVLYYSNIGKEGKANFRYLTPRECFLLMGFEEKDFDRLIENNFNVNKRGRFFSQAKLIKMAGNSIVVDVLVDIFRHIDILDGMLTENEIIRKRAYSQEMMEITDYISNEA